MVPRCYQQVVFSDGTRAVRIVCPEARLTWVLSPQQYAAYVKDERKARFPKLMADI